MDPVRARPSRRVRRQPGDVWRDLVERSPDGLLVVDETGQIRLANLAAAQLLGKPVGELVKSTTAEVLGEDTKLQVRASAPSDGWAVVSIRDGPGQLEEGFLNAISHEMRTPLTVVIGLAATLQSKRSQLSEERATELTDRLLSAAQRLDRLLSGMLDLDRLRRGLFDVWREPTNVTRLAARVVENLNASGHWIEVRGPDTITVPLDVARVEKLLEHLLVNVLRHTPAGTPAWVVVSPEGDGCIVSVEDAGPGVADELKHEIFRPFTQGPVAEHAPGTGIGLAVVDGFARLHGGRAWVEDRPGGGASFRVLLPPG